MRPSTASASKLRSRRASVVRRQTSRTATRYSHQKPSLPRRMSGRRSSLDHAIEQASSTAAVLATTWRATVRCSAVALAAKNAAMSSWRLDTATAPATDEVIADTHDGGRLVALDGLVDVVVDQCIQLALAAHVALDDERAARCVGGPVADDDHAADAHRVDHALAV